MHPPILDKRNQQRACLRGQFRLRQQRRYRRLIRATANRRLGADDTDFARFRDRCRRFCRGLHHAENRQIVLALEHVQRGGAHRAAGNHDRLEVKTAQKRDILPRIAHDGLHRTPAVRHAPRVAKVNDILARQQPDHLAHRRQTAHAGVEHADWSCIHAFTSKTKNGQARPARFKIRKLAKGYCITNPSLRVGKPAARRAAAAACPSGD